MINQLKFQSIEDAVMAIMPQLLNDLRNAGNIAGFSAAVHGVSPETIEENVSSLIHFIETHDVQREMQAEISECGVIDLTAYADSGALDPMDALRGLYARWAARPENANKFVDLDGRRLYT